MKKKSIIHLIYFLELASNDAKTFHELIETRFTQISEKKLIGLHLLTLIKKDDIFT